MSESYSDKVFEFSKVLVDGDEWAGDIKVVQVGETCLDKGACIEEHIQVCHEVTLVISGKGILTADNEKIPCSIGDVQIISKGVTHSIIADSEAPLRYIHFAFDFCDDEATALSAFYGQCRNIMLHDSGDIRNILNMIVEEYFNEPLFCDVARDCLIQILLIIIWRKVHIQIDKYKPTADKEPMSNIVYNIIRYIDSHLSEQLTVKCIADQFSYSNRHISRLFKEKTGVSLKEYIIIMRMKYAESMLIEGKSSLMEIANFTGYESVQSFCKSFKKHTGKTPGELRK